MYSGKVFYASLLDEFFRTQKSPYTSHDRQQTTCESCCIGGGLLLGGGSLREMVWVFFGLKWKWSQLGEEL